MVGPPDRGAATADATEVEEGRRQIVALSGQGRCANHAGHEADEAGQEAPDGRCGGAARRCSGGGGLQRHRKPGASCVELGSHSREEPADDARRERLRNGSALPRGSRQCCSRHLSGSPPLHGGRAFCVAGGWRHQAAEVAPGLLGCPPKLGRQRGRIRHMCRVPQQALSAPVDPGAIETASPRQPRLPLIRLLVCPLQPLRGNLHEDAAPARAPALLAVAGHVACPTSCQSLGGFIEALCVPLLTRGALGAPRGPLGDGCGRRPQELRQPQP
mmetsp:Transcript_148947/g.415038  ORF Transcript_148947/g.415038 Transcript_148947/m.415038 type:complete len:273 (-) Transcript_148947:201-1019(-)